MSVFTPEQKAILSGISGGDGGSTFDRLLRQESGGRQFNTNGGVVTSSKGATGIAQVMPATGPEAAKLAGVEWNPERFKSDPEYNKSLGRAYFDKQLATFGNERLALAAYNAGPGAVQKAIQRAEKSGGDPLAYLPEETQKYVPAILGAGFGVKRAASSPWSQQPKYGDPGFNKAIEHEALQDAADESPVSTSLKRGWEGLKHNAGLFLDNVTDDSQGAAERIKAKREWDDANPAPRSSTKFVEQFQQLAEDDYAGMLATAVKNPGGALNQMVEQTPNSLPALALQIPVGIASSALMATGWGAPLAVGLQGLAAFVGNALPEGGAYIEEQLGKAGINPNDTAAVAKWIAENRSKNLEGGVKKAGVISLVDGATGYLGGKLIAGPSIRFAQAEAAVFAKAGVKTTDKAAVAAARATPAYKQAMAQPAQELLAATTRAQKTVRELGGLGLETAGEGIGEYAGSYAADGTASVKDAVLESMMGAGTSAAMTGANMTLGAMKGPDGSRADLDALAATPQPAQPTITPNSPLTNAASIAQAATPQPAAVDPFNGRLSAMQSFVEDKAFIQALRGAQGYGPESVTEALSAFAKARNPNLDPLVRERALSDLEGFVQSFNGRPNFTFGNRQEEPQPGQQVAPFQQPGGAVGPATTPDDGRTLNGEVITRPGTMAGSNPNQISAPPVLGLPTEEALQAKRDADAAYEQAYQDLVKPESLGASDQDLAAKQQTTEKRRAVLDAILADPATANPAARLAAELKRQGFRDTTPTQAELDTIQRFSDIQNAEAEPDIIPSSPNELDPYQVRQERPQQPAKPRLTVEQIKQAIANGATLSKDVLTLPDGSRVKLKGPQIAAARQAILKKAQDGASNERPNAEVAPQAPESGSPVVQGSANAVDARAGAGAEPQDIMPAGVDSRVGQNAPDGNGGVAEPSAETFDVSTRTDDQLRYLAENGKPGWKESARDEIAKREQQKPAETARPYTPPASTSEVSDSWLGVWKRGATPNQDALMSAVQKALNAGLFYNNDVKDFVAKELGVTDAERAVGSGTVDGGAFGYDVYHARKELDRRAAEAANSRAVDELGLSTGVKLGVLVFNDSKVTKAVEVESVAEDKQSVTIKGKRGNTTVSGPVSPVSIKRAIERAEERGARKPDTSANESGQNQPANPTQDQQPQGIPADKTTDTPETFDVSTRTDDQLRYLAEKGKAGWREAAQAELAKRTPADVSLTNEGKTTQPVEPEAENVDPLDKEISDAAAHLADVLADVFGAKLNITGPQHSAADLLPAMQKVIGLLVQKGFKTFAQAVGQTARMLRDNGAGEHVEKITPRQWKAAYQFAADMPGVEGAESEESVAALSADKVQAIVSGHVDKAKAEAEARTDTNPSDAQKEAENYRKGKFSWNGQTIAVENPKGSERTGKGEDGTEWRTVMPATYGYFLGTVGADKDHVDVFMGDTLDAPSFWVINQTQPDSAKFDEHKVVAGVTSADEAKRIYLDSFSDGFGDKVFSSIAGPYPVGELADVLPKLKAKKPFGVKKESPRDAHIRAKEEAYAARREGQPVPPKALEIVRTEAGKEFDKAEAIHKDPGQPAEAVMPAVVAESIQKSARNTEFNPAEAKKWLIGEIDKAVANVPAENAALAADLAREKVKTFDMQAAERKYGKGSKAASSARDSFNAVRDSNVAKIAQQIGFVTFDVPGDGKFKVLNTVDGLNAFRSKVEKSSGFKAPANKPPVMERETDTGSYTPRDALADGEFLNAYELARLQGKPLRFSVGIGRPNAYTDASDVKGLIPGFKTFVGRKADSSKMPWAVIEESTGLAIGDGGTSKAAAIAAAKAKMKGHEQAIADKLKRGGISDAKLQDQLEADWIKWAEEREGRKLEDAEEVAPAAEVETDWTAPPSSAVLRQMGEELTWVRQGDYLPEEMVAIRSNAVQKYLSENPLAKEKHDEAIALAWKEAQDKQKPIPEPTPLDFTPKQYHEARMKWVAQEYGLSDAEVRQDYDTPVARDADNQAWVDAVRQAFKDGTELTRATLDKLEELRPGALLSNLHDYPEARIPAGYQLPSARKAENEASAAKRESKKQIAASFAEGRAKREELTPSDLTNIFAGLSARGLAKSRAKKAAEAHPQAEQIAYVQDNFLDILTELEDSGIVKINCD